MQKLHPQTTHINLPIVLYSNHITSVNRELALTQGASCFQKNDSLSELMDYLIKITGEENAVAVETFHHSVFKK